MVLERSVVCEGSEMVAATMEEQQEAQQGRVGQLISFLVLPFVGSPWGINIQVERHPEVPPHMERDLVQVQDRGVQEKEKNFSISGDVALHNSMQNVQQPERGS